MNSNQEFLEQVKNNIESQGADDSLKQSAWKWAVEASSRYGYSYNFE
jgi:hypothetical protein